MSQRSRRTNDDHEFRPRRKNLSASQPSASNRNGYDDDAGMTTSSQPSQGKVPMPEDEKNHIVATVIRYLFIADRTKTAVQRIHIIKNAMDNNGKHFRYIMKHVKEVLANTFGYNLVELEGNKYILTNNIANNDLHLKFSKPEKAELVLLFIALSHIFMIDESGCAEEELFDLFRSLEIVVDDNFIHDYFGNVKYLLTEKFVKQGYLELVKVDNSDPPLQHYQWGQRAENELTPRNVLEFMSKIFGGRPLTTWPAQFKQMQMRESLNNDR